MRMTRDNGLFPCECLSLAISSLPLNLKWGTGRRSGYSCNTEDTKCPCVCKRKTLPGRGVHSKLSQLGTYSTHTTQNKKVLNWWKGNCLELLQTTANISMAVVNIAALLYGPAFRQKQKLWCSAQICFNVYQANSPTHFPFCGLLKHSEKTLKFKRPKLFTSKCLLLLEDVPRNFLVMSSIILSSNS